MNTPRIEIDLNCIKYNAQKIRSWFRSTPVKILVISKLIHGCPRIIHAMREGGLDRFADSRIINIKRIQADYPEIAFGFIRIPHHQEVADIISHCTWSSHSQLETLECFDYEAKRHDKIHGIMLMVEMGDLREGVMPDDLPKLLEFVLGSKYLELRGLSVNLACFGGIQHDKQFLLNFIHLKGEMERRFGINFPVVSYGNSAVLRHLRSNTTAGINEIRLGEAIFLGTEPGCVKKIEGLKKNAFQLVGSVLECSQKPKRPYGGRQGLNAFGEILRSSSDYPYHILLDLGRLDTHSNQLFNPEVEILGGSSDYLVLRSKKKYSVGSEIKFSGTYEAILRAMHSPFVNRIYGKM